MKQINIYFNKTFYKKGRILMDEINVDVENLKNKISDLKQIRADI